MQAPLLTVASGQDRYKPFTIGDVQAIVDKLPLVVEGGSLWLDKLDSLTAGHRLALGDFRAVAASLHRIPLGEEDTCVGDIREAGPVKGDGDPGVTQDEVGTEVRQSASSVMTQITGHEIVLNTPGSRGEEADQPEAVDEATTLTLQRLTLRSSPDNTPTAEPVLSLTVEDQSLPFLVDTGTTVSTLRLAPKDSLSSRCITLMGFSGETTTLPFTYPLVTRIGHQTLSHSPAVPTNLLGRDLLIKLGATILCSPDGLEVRLPDGTRLPCNGGPRHDGQYLIQPVIEQYADIYWGLLLPETTAHQGILSAYLQWKPWISQLHPLLSPPDPPHVTLFYDRMQVEWYQEQFQEQLEGQTWQIITQNIYVAPEGVAAGVTLTAEQASWYMMSEEAARHVSLALHPQHQAKELGSIVKRALAQTDWVPTSISQVSFLGRQISQKGSGLSPEHRGKPPETPPETTHCKRDALVPRTHRLQ
ncbi:hypothetical protein NFI96_032033, partial [Prochilodus magdalenae]